MQHLAIKHAIQFLNNEHHFSSPGAIAEAKEIANKLQPQKPANFVSQFKVAAISSNTNAFGLWGVVIIDKTGLAFRVGMNHLSKPNVGDVLDVTLNGSSIHSIAGKSFEIPHKLPNAPASVLKELFEDKPVTEDKTVVASETVPMYEPNKTYKLNVKETNRKTGKYHYTITDETGEVISERKSNRTYVAATIDGQFYFGRRDLIGKGEHGKHVKRFAAQEQTPIAYL